MLTASAEAGLIDQQEYFQKRVASHDLSHYYLLERGDFAYNHSSSSNATLGIIKRLDAYDSGCLSTLYIVFHPKRDIDSDYLLHYFESSAWHGDVVGMVTEGARSHGLLNISPDTFFTARCSFPSLPEQRRIGEFFSTLDSLIAAAERQEALLKQKKQAYLQLMFPCENENEPRLRFTGFSGEWQQRQLGEVAEVVIGQSPEGRYSSDNQNGVALAQGNTDIADGVFVPRVWTSRPTKVVPADTLLVSVRAPVGDVAVTPVPACIGRGFAGIPGNSFLRYSLERLKTSGHWNRVSSGSVLDAITSKELLQTPISIATNQEEQCIGKFFTRLDHLIEIVGRHAETLRTMKRAYSQRMFI